MFLPFLFLSQSETVTGEARLYVFLPGWSRFVCRDGLRQGEGTRHWLFGMSVMPNFINQQQYVGEKQRTQVLRDLGIKPRQRGKK